jgi:hypothetical protein
LGEAVAGNGGVCAVAECLLSNSSMGGYLRGVQATTSRPNFNQKSHSVAV